MLRFYPAPQSHFRPQQRYTYFDDDDDEESSYYEYQRAVREQRERRALEEAQARRRAQEEREQYLRRLRAQQQEEEEYRRWQLERRRAAYLENQRQKQAAIAQYKRQQLEEQQREEQQHRRQRQQQQQFDIFAQLFGLPAPPHVQSQPQCQPSPSVAALPVPAPTPRKASPPSMSYTEAVTLIQSLAKDKISLTKRLHALRAISSRLEAAKASFRLPESLVFDSEKSTSSSPVLAFSVENKAYHAFEETLTRLLTELDSITSEGSKKVKEERKSLAVQIEGELNRLDNLKVEQWQKQSQAQKVEIEKEPAHTELEKEGRMEVENEEAEQVLNDVETSKADSVNDTEATSIESATLAASDDAPQVEHRMEVDEVQTAPPTPEQDNAIQPVPMDEVASSKVDLSTTSQIDAPSPLQSDPVSASAGPAISTSTQSQTAEADSQENSPLDGYQVDSDEVAEVKDEDKIAEDGEQERVENVDDQDSGSDFEMIE